MKSSCDNALFGLPVTICVLCYGNYPTLAERILTSLLEHTPSSAMVLRLGLNAVSDSSMEVIKKLLPAFPGASVFRSEVNSYKLPMMQRMFHDIKIGTEWTIWFDDDSFVFRDDWLLMLQCQSRLHPEVDMWGQKFFMRGGACHRNFIMNAPWYQGLELSKDSGPDAFRIRFIAGGFWAIRTQWIYKLPWPDARLIHFGDDYMLGEAIRQHGGFLGNSHSGIAINRCDRRAPKETPRCDALQ